MWRDWSSSLTARVAQAVKARRKALGLNAADLAVRTRVGKPLTRAVISDLETGRKKTLEVSELLTLAVALDIPPLLLLFPDYPAGSVEIVPGVTVSSERAADWLAGRGVIPGAESNAGTALVRAASRRRELENRRELASLDNDLAQAGVKHVVEVDRRVIDGITAEINDTSTTIDAVERELWGNDA